MRTLQRNKQTIWYALYLGVEDAVDAAGNLTGEKIVIYTAPRQAKMNISGGRGAADIETFGLDNPFTRTAITDDLVTEFSTDTIWWFGVAPGTTALTTEDGKILMTEDGLVLIEETERYELVPYNYRCTGVVKTINTCTIALAEVDVSDPPEIGE